MNIKRELIRVLPLLIIGGLFLAPDLADLKTVLFSMSIIMLIIYVSHVVRKTLFPYLDLEHHMNKALDNPIAASIVFASVMFLISTIIQATVMLLR